MLYLILICFVQIKRYKWQKAGKCITHVTNLTVAIQGSMILTADSSFKAIIYIQYIKKTASILI